MQDLEDIRADSLAASYRTPFIDPRDPMADEADGEPVDRREGDCRRLSDAPYFGQERRVEARRFDDALPHPGAELPMPKRLSTVPAELDHVQRLKARGVIFETYRADSGVWCAGYRSGSNLTPISDHATEDEADEAAAALNGRVIPKRDVPPIATAWRDPARPAFIAWLNAKNARRPHSDLPLEVVL